jgi:hypothetical protein
MEPSDSPTRTARTHSTVRVALTPDMAEALDRRARRNDRFAWLEAGRIIRETLLRDGDLSAEKSR